MNGSTIIFYLLAAFTLISGFLAVTTSRIFRAAIFLLFSLIGIAGIYFWMEYEFIAAVQIIVYVGGIVVLIIFSIFLTQHSGEKLPSPKAGRAVFSAMAAILGFMVIITQVFKYSFTKSSGMPADASIAGIGKQMLGVKENGYALPFEVVSMLLLAAMIACIVIALRTTKQHNAI